MVWAFPERGYEASARAVREVRRSITAAIVSAVALAAPAHAAPTSFTSSLEAGDPQPAWTNTAERTSGVTRPGIPGNVTDAVVAVRASGENEEGGEVKENLVDGAEDTKWLLFESKGWVEFELSDPVKVVRYALTSANDHAERDPRDWTLQGSNDGTTWTSSTRAATKTSPIGSRPISTPSPTTSPMGG